MKKLHLFLLLSIFLSLFFISNSAFAEPSFYQSKKLMKKVYYDHQYTFYCGCPYEYKQVKGKEKAVINATACGYKPFKDEERGRYVEWEHIVPASYLGKNLSCWKNKECVDKNGKRFGGRKCCRQKDKLFNMMEADMYNLVASIGELNNERSNYPFGIIASEERKFGACDFEVKGNIVEPKEDIRGDIARTYFYMADKYGIYISPEDMEMFTEWHKADPVDDWERTRAKRIEQLQGNKNPFIN